MEIDPIRKFSETLKSLSLDFGVKFEQVHDNQVKLTLNNKSVIITKIQPITIKDKAVELLVDFCSTEWKHKEYSVEEFESMIKRVRKHLEV